MTNKIKCSLYIACFVIVSGTSLIAQKSAIFRGGGGDGWAYNKYVPTTSNIYKGGNSDGWGFNAYLPITASIAKGGAGDGWSWKNNIIPNSAQLYAGGAGDGWARQDMLAANLGVDIITSSQDVEMNWGENTASDIMLYPQPAQNMLTVRPIGNAYQLDNYTVKILSIIGAILISENISGGVSANIDISALPAGQYILQTYSSTQSFVKPLMIAR